MSFESGFGEEDLWLQLFYAISECEIEFVWLNLLYNKNKKYQKYRNKILLIKLNF